MAVVKSLMVQEENWTEMILQGTKMRRSPTGKRNRDNLEMTEKVTLCFCSSKLRTSSNLLRYIDSKFSEG